MKALRRLLAVAGVELRFGLRRGWPVVGVAAIALVISAGTLYLAARNLEDAPREDAPAASAQALGMVWPTFPMLALLVLGLVAAPALPADRQFGVAELLRSTPLTGGVYLLGKILGTWAAIALTGIAALLLHLTLHWLLLGPVSAGLYLELLLLGALPTALWASALGVIAACGAATRRAAVLLGLLAGLLGPLAWGLFAPPPSPLFVALDPVAAWSNQVVTHQPASDFVLARYGALNSLFAAPTAEQAALSLLAAWLLLLLAGGLARLWLWRKENF